MADDSGTNPDVQAAALISAAFTAMIGRNGRADLKTPLPEIQAIHAAPDDVRRRCIVAAADEQGWYGENLLSVIAYKPAGLTLDDVTTVMPMLPRLLSWHRSLAHSGAQALLHQIEDTWANLDDEDRARVRASILRVAPHIGHATAAITLRKLAASGADVPYDLVDDVSEVGKALRGALEASPEPGDAKSKLINVLVAYPVTGKPRAAWQSDADSALAALHDPVAVTGALLDAAISAPDFPYQQRRDITYFVTEAIEAFLCGTALLAGQAAASAGRDNADLLPRLRRLALKAITIVGGSYGNPRSIRLANHCVQAIAAAALPWSITELIKTERGTRHGSLLRQVRASVDALAAAQGLTRDELLEMAVEDHGLSPDGTRRLLLSGSWLAVIQADARTARLGYEDPDGQARKSLPPMVKQASADSLAVTSKDLKAIRTTIGNERARLDACLTAGRMWHMPRWRDLYLDHPVTGQLTRALIWTFSTSSEGKVVTGIPVSAETLVIRDSTEVPIPADGGAEVRLWHPVHASADEVRAWRQLLIGRRLVQPVKQAFREVYVLTPAEEATREYSNRFAGHIFRQEQARALMKGRSWAPVPMAVWDDGIDHGIARREYPRSGGQALRAEFFFDPADYQDITGNGLIRYCASDQVRFFDAGTGEAVPLAEVAPLTFSETMRDVDLFIGVTSVGADPEWLDRGEGRRFGDYWNRYAFGDLGAGAEIRREVLAGLMPMLAIADRCDLEDRFLVVRGDLRTYRIHLGSGNILMSPNDQYLCIVAARDARAGKLFLPFDDDPVLSLILSKAFLLANDTKITDQSIIRQIGAR